MGAKLRYEWISDANIYMEGRGRASPDCCGLRLRRRRLGRRRFTRSRRLARGWDNGGGRYPRAEPRERSRGEDRLIGILTGGILMSVGPVRTDVEPLLPLIPVLRGRRALQVGGL